MDHFDRWWPESFRLVQDEGTGLLIQGTREWTDYQASAAITPHMAASAGIGARVQGLRRYYALLLAGGDSVRLVKALDGERVLAEAPLRWEARGTYQLCLQVVGDRIQGWVDDQLLFDLRDGDRPLDGGGVALICTEGRMATDAVTVRPASD
jgi:hypothetical protein